MKKLLALVVVLSMAGLANAGLSLMVNDSTNDVALTGPGIGSLDATDNQLANVGVFIGWNEFIALDFSIATNSVIPGAILPIDDAEILALLGVKSAIFVDLAKPVIPIEVISGKVVDGLGITYTGIGQEVGVLSLINGDTFEVMDSLFVTPEPMTLALLGLGALVLRRK